MTTDALHKSPESQVKSTSGDGAGFTPAQHEGYKSDEHTTKPDPAVVNAQSDFTVRQFGLAAAAVLFGDQNTTPPAGANGADDRTNPQEGGHGGMGEMRRVPPDPFKKGDGDGHGGCFPSEPADPLANGKLHALKEAHDISGPQNKPGFADSLLQNLGDIKASDAVKNPIGEVAGAVAKTIFDGYQNANQMIKSDALKDTGKRNVENKAQTIESLKREKAVDLLDGFAQQFPEGFAKTQELMRAMALGQKLDATTLTDLTQAATKELSADKDGATREKLNELSKLMNDQYGIDMKLDAGGMSISDGKYSLKVSADGSLSPSVKGEDGKDVTLASGFAGPIMSTIRQTMDYNAHFGMPQEKSSGKGGPFGGADNLHKPDPPPRVIWNLQSTGQQNAGLAPVADRLKDSEVKESK